MILLLFGPEWLVGLRGLDDRLTAAERAKQVTEERRSLLALLAAVGAAIGLYYTHLRHQLERESSQLLAPLAIRGLARAGREPRNLNKQP